MKFHIFELKDDSGAAKPATVAVIAVLATLLVAGSGAYLAGWLDFAGMHDHGATAANGGEESGDKETLYTCGMHPWIISEEPGQCPICGMDLVVKRDDDTGAGESTGERKVIYWRAPMDPTEIYHEPGKSKMGMDLVPVYEDEVIGGVEVKIDPVTQQNMGIRVEPVTSAELTKTIRTYGHVTYDQTLNSQVSPRFSGWIEKIYVDFTGQKVKKGQPLFEIYSPELIAAQEEYLVAYRNLGGKGDAFSDLLDAARRRLDNFGVANTEIAALEKSGKVSRTLKVRSPVTGTVIARMAEEGAFVKSGMAIFQIADLSRVWIEAHIYEYELPWVEVGQEAEVRLPYQPGKVYDGHITFIEPYLQAKTRDVVVRLEFDNPAEGLKPDMYADVRIKSRQAGKGLTVPSEAVIRTGERNVVFVSRGNGKFTPREVTLGLTLDGSRVQVTSGLAPGEEVVTSGQFMLDSESRLKEAVQKMLEAKAPKQSSGGGGAGGDDSFFNDMDGDKGKGDDDFFKDIGDDKSAK